MPVSDVYLPKLEVNLHRNGRVRRRRRNRIPGSSFIALLFVASAPAVSAAPTCHPITGGPSDRAQIKELLQAQKELRQLLRSKEARQQFADSEKRLGQFFEGKRIVLKVDMPGSSGGLTICPDAEEPVDHHSWDDALEAYGTALHKGDAVTVTKVHFNLGWGILEFQLGGGGYGPLASFFNTITEPTYNAKNVRSPDEKSDDSERRRAEKDLEKERSTTKDPKRKQEIDDQLEELRREHTDEKTTLEQRAADMQAAADAEQEKKEEQQRLSSGSRFNIVLFPPYVPDRADPEKIVAILKPYMDFPSKDFAVSSASVAPGPR